MPTGPLPEPGPHRGLREVRLLRNTVIPLKAPHSAGSGAGEGRAGGGVNRAPTVCHSCLFSDTKNWGGFGRCRPCFLDVGTDQSGGRVSLDARAPASFLQRLVATPSLCCPPGDLVSQPSVAILVASVDPRSVTWSKVSPHPLREGGRRPQKARERTGGVDPLSFAAPTPPCPVPRQDPAPKRRGSCFCLLPLKSPK